MPNASAGSTPVCRVSWENGKGRRSQLAQVDVFELDQHRRAFVDLEGQLALYDPLRVVVVELAHVTSLIFRMMWPALAVTMYWFHWPGLTALSSSSGLPRLPTTRTLPSSPTTAFCPRSARISRRVYSMMTPVQRPSALKSAWQPISGSFSIPVRSRLRK